MEMIVGLIIGILIGAVFSGAIIWLVGKMNVGLTVKNFGWAMVAGLFIGVVNGVILQFVPSGEGIIGATVRLLVSAAVILLAGKLFSGITVEGYRGALIAAFIMALIGFLVGMFFGPAAVSTTG